MTQSRLRALLRKQKYEFTGEHSAIKICTWTKKSLRDEDFCYKQKFYGIKSHLCAQISPSLGYCQNSCIFCWRELDLTLGTDMKPPYDDPKDIIENSIRMQRKLLSGFGGFKGVNAQKLQDAKEPMHFAISLTGEPTLYPKLNELIEELHKRGKSTFLVSNGLLPERIRDIVPPTQLYISVDAPDEEIWRKIDRSNYRDGWTRLLETMDVLRDLKDKTRTTLRFTLIKGMNMTNTEGWAEMIRRSEPLFVEVKAYMFVGSSRQRLEIGNMPRHNEIMEYAEKIAQACGYRIIDEKKESRVALLSKKDFPGRIMF